MKKRVFALLLVLAICVCAAVPAFAAEEKTPCVLDYAELLTEAEADALETKLEAIAKEFSVEVAVVTVYTCAGDERGAYAKSVYQDCGYGLGENKDGILLLIEMDEENRGWTIYAKGLGDKAMPESERKSTGEAMTSDLKNGNYAAAFNTFAQKCEERIDIAINGEPFNPVMSLIISLVIGLVLAFIVTGVMKGKLKSVRAQRAATNYVRQGSLNVTESYELFLYRTAERREKPKSNDSDSSGSREGSTSGSF